MLTLLLLLLSICALANTGHTDAFYSNQFNLWIAKHQKSYDSDEFQARYAIFKNNYDFVQAHNAEGHSHKVALNHLADLSNEEYQRIYLGLKGEASAKKKQTATLMVGDSVEPAHSKRTETSKPEPSSKQRYVQAAPLSVDWQLAGAVTSVKNQESCSCCWAFASTAAIEGMNKLFGNGVLTDLSNQNLLDCTGTSSTCNGGYTFDAINYTVHNNGIASLSAYPQYANTKKACRYKAAMRETTVNGVVAMLPNSEAGLLAQIVIQPIAVSIYASLPSFQFYSSGVYSDPACPSNEYNHAVLLVGFGVDPSGAPYWRIKNQWGTYWGEQGYMQIVRGVNKCAIAAQSVYPTMAVPTPTFYVYGDSFLNSWMSNAYGPVSAVNPTCTTSYKGAYSYSAGLAPTGVISLSLLQGSLGYTTLKYSIFTSVAAQFTISVTAGDGITWTMSQSTWANKWVPSTMKMRPHTSFSQINFTNTGSELTTVYLDEIYFM